MQSWRWLVKSDYYLHTHLDSGFFIQIEKEESEHFYKDFYCGENVFCNPKHFYRGRFDFQQPKITNPMVDVLGKRLFFKTLKFIGHLCLFFIFQAGFCSNQHLKFLFTPNFSPFTSSNSKTAEKTIQLSPFFLAFSKTALILSSPNISTVVDLIFNSRLPKTPRRICFLLPKTDSPR